MRTETDDVVAIWRLQSRYADIVTRRAFAELHEIFLPDTAVHLDTVTRPAQTITGPEAFGAFVAGAIERYDHFAFVILNTIVEVVPPAQPGGESTTATGRIFMCEVRHDRDSDTWPNAHGRYEDRYEHDGERWRIAERHYRSMARQGPDGVVLGLPDLPTLENQ